MSEGGRVRGSEAKSIRWRTRGRVRAISMCGCARYSMYISIVCFYVSVSCLPLC